MAGAPPAPGPDGRRAAVDTEVFHALVEQLGGGSATLGPLIDTYLTDADQRMTLLVAAVKGDDGEGVARAAHGLRSGSALFGALPLAELLQRTETLVRAGTADIRSLGQEIEAAYHDVTATLHQLQLSA